MGKKVIFDVGHPAQVHNFKYVYLELKQKGWEVLFTAKDKEMTINLLESYNIPYQIIGKTRKGILHKIFDLIFTLIRFNKILRQFKPDLIVCRFSPHSCWMGRLNNIPVIGLADSEHTRFLDKLTVPFVNIKLTACSYRKNLGKNHIRFYGNIELFYLHPKRFSVSKEVLKSLNIDNSQKYVIVRFVSWNAHHDIGERGLTMDEKNRIINLVKKKYNVFITSERDLPESFKKYQLKAPPDVIHDLLANAEIYIGEGASMASEAACLGVPAVYINTLSAGSIEEEVEHGLVFYFRNTNGLFQIIQKLLDKNDLKKEFEEKKNDFLKDKIDVTGFLSWFIEDYPESAKIMIENSEYQHVFK